MVTIMKNIWNFIKATDEYNTFEKAVAAPYIRKRFTCESAAQGTIKIAACGFYVLFVNGINITKGFLAPYICNTDHYIYYDEYDVALDEGENVIGILLGNGFQNNPGGYIWDFDKAPFRSAPKVAVHLQYVDHGEIVELVTDNTFKTHPSAILADDYRFGETYDANAEIENWTQKNFDDSSWDDALLTNAPEGEITLCRAQPLVVETELKPVNIFKEDDSYIYDFGVSNAGVCRLNINGCKGQKIELQHADLLKDGKFHLDNIWFVRDYWERDKDIVHKDTFICKGGAET